MTQAESRRLDLDLGSKDDTHSRNSPKHELPKHESDFSQLHLHRVLSGKCSNLPRNSQFASKGKGLANCEDYFKTEHDHGVAFVEPEENDRIK